MARKNLENHVALTAEQSREDHSSTPLVVRGKTIHPVTLQRMLDGAANYAAADRSDPFTYQRCLAHIRFGVASVLPNGDDAFYKADPFPEMRELPDGTPYNITVYRNVQRP